MSKMSDIRRPTRFVEDGARRGSLPSVEQALGALKGEYVIVPRRRVRSWRFWLAVGLVAGAVLAIFIIARRSTTNGEEAENAPASYRVSF